MSTPIDFSGYILNGLKMENLTQEVLLGPAFRLLKGTCSSDDYPFDLSKPLPLIRRGNRQRVPFEFFINNDLKYLQGGISTMTYTTSTTKIKATQYDVPGIEDMVPNIWSPVKVAYDKILAVTHVSVMRKHGYGYLEEIVVRRADNALYRFKEGDFPRLRINDIEDMLLLVVQNRLTNLSGDDVADFAIALRMFTRSLVIQKRVEDLQLGVKSYQKKINITKPDTTRPDLRKRHPYTPYKDPQGFIYVDDHKRNRLMRSDKLYKFRHQQAAKGKEDDEEFGEICWFDTSAGNPVNKILLKLNLPDHRCDGRFLYSDTESSEVDQVLKLKKFKKDALLKLFKIIKSRKVMRWSGLEVTSSEMAKSQDGEKRLCLVMISRCSR
ncbi:hypothetical protein Tco_0155567 [Tanacetum coccineum]